MSAVEVGKSYRLWWTPLDEEQRPRARTILGPELVVSIPFERKEGRTFDVGAFTGVTEYSTTEGYSWRCTGRSK